jgi:TolB protein
MLLHKLRLLLPWALGAVLLAPVAQAQTPLRIDITGVGQKLIPVAVAPFEATQPEQSKAAATIVEVIQANLARSGVISVLDIDVPETPYNENTTYQPLLMQWRQGGVEAVVLGSISTLPNNRMETRFILVDTVQQASLGGLAINAPATAIEARRTGHRISDFIYEKLTGEPGFFATRLAFVRKDGPKHSLVISDSDGENQQVALRSAEPLISLAWSPDGTQIAYVSYERRDGISKPIVYAQNLASGRRIILANEKGSNSSPAWSPDGKRLAVVLTRDGNSQIYQVNADGTGLSRLSNSNGIDTEPTFSPDGNFVYFTSDRGGSPQIYRVSANGGASERLTFNGSFNARPQISPDGRYMSYVTVRNRAFRIAVMNLTNREETLVSQGPKDDSPSFAPNSKWVIYSSKNQGRTVLSAATIDGKLRTRLSTSEGDIKGPAWGKLP